MVEYKPISRWIKIRWTCPKDESKEPQPYFLFKGKRIYLSECDSTCPIVLRTDAFGNSITNHPSYISGYIYNGNIWEETIYVQLCGDGEHVKLYMILEEEENEKGN